MSDWEYKVNIQNCIKYSKHEGIEMRILVVDDNVDLADNICDALEIKDYIVDSAYSGEDALALFNKNTYDLAILDVKLPGKNGVECFMEMRVIQPNCKIIMMTGYRVVELIQQAIDHGALRVMHKPFEMEEIFSLVEEVKPDGIILVVDDNPSFIESIEELLTCAGYSVYSAIDGKEAVDKVLNGNMDLLLLDLQLPVMSGLEVYLKLKEQNRVIPTIIVTAYSKEEEETINILRSMKVTGILSKPFDPEHLLNTIKDILIVQ